MQSTLEAGMVRRVLRPHGLPVGRRQAWEQTRHGLVCRDMVLEEYGVVLEPDGHAWHGDPAARARDMTRDLAAAGTGLLTVRLGWPHIHQTPCTTAAGLAGVLTHRGWRGRPRACSSDFALAAPMSAHHPPALGG
jgi:hypothetical protein